MINSGKFLISASEKKQVTINLGNQFRLKFRSLPGRRAMYQMPAFINASILRQTAIVTILHSAKLNMISGTHHPSRRRQSSVATDPVLSTITVPSQLTYTDTPFSC